MSIEKVEVEAGKSHACTGYVMCCEETGRTIASFWHEDDAQDVMSKVNGHGKLVNMLEQFANMVMPTAGELYIKCDEAKKLLNEINNRGKSDE